MIDAGEPFLVKRLQNGEAWELIVTKHRAGAQELRTHTHTSLPLVCYFACIATAATGNL